MNTPSSQELAAVPRPSLITSLRTGFDAIANHVEILLLPVLLDLLLWLAPHFTVRTQVERALQLLNQLLAQEESLAPELVAASQETWQTFGGQFNLLGLLRSLPVGVPSLMAWRAPTETPFGAPVFTEVAGLPGIFLFAVAASLVGLAVGSLYFLLVAQASAGGPIHWATLLRDWPLATLRSVGLFVVMIGILLAVTLPVSCLLGSLALSGLMFSQIGTLLVGVILVWWMFPLIFSAHGYFLYRERLWLSIRRSIHLTRLTFPITGTLILLVILVSQVMDMLWNTPQASSWLMLLGVAGHAFIASALLAATFAYYHSMNRWLQAQARVSLTPPDQTAKA